MEAVSSVVFFFFQAEDGIRDGHVTGVQTCALPISLRRSRSAMPRSYARKRERLAAVRARSEERRVGKECRSRWSADHEKKKIEEGVDVCKLAGAAFTLEELGRHVVIG